MKREGFKKSKHWVVANGVTPKEEGVHSLELRFRLCVRSPKKLGGGGGDCLSSEGALPFMWVRNHHKHIKSGGGIVSVGQMQG
jgi:hypothetical protein